MIKIVSVSFLIAASANAGFVSNQPTIRTTSTLGGYLDDYTEELTKPAEEKYNPDLEDRELTKFPRDQVDRAGPGNFDNYVDFEEFDGGDGQMGVAGDGNAGLEKIGSSPTMAKSMAKSKIMSAKNAWGTTTGYADKLREQGMETSRAQQFENWSNQREVWRKQQTVRNTEARDDNSQRKELNWRELANFGVERNQEFDLDEAFGEVVAGEELEDTIELHSMMNKMVGITIKAKNEFMGFADFRAAFTKSSGSDWVVSPGEGAINAKESTEFIVKFKPSKPETQIGYFVLETEDFKKTWKFVGKLGY